ncbi:MAG: hypothetical protein KJ954_13880 [Alphaproteobacteria bacterium]|nr:hypothetical protein [Alphaproteobacteria bacterium]
MEIRHINHTITGDEFRLVFLGDAHVGTIHCEEGRLKRDIQRIADDKDCRVLLLGDSIDCINFSDKRFDPSAIKPTYQLKDISKLAQVQSADFCGLCQPLVEARSIDGFFEGNHEYDALKRYHFAVCEGMKMMLRLGQEKFLESSAILRYDVSNGRNEVRFVVYAEHGSGSSSDAPAALKKIKKKAFDLEADIYVCGHHHKRIKEIIPKIDVRWDTRSHKMKEHRIGFAVTGSYLRTYLEGVSGYGEKRSYSPVELGATVLRWNLAENHFEIENF